MLADYIEKKTGIWEGYCWMPTADEFREELYRAMHEAFSRGSEHLELEAGELHRRLGGYPGPDHRMPNCCQVMKAAIISDGGDLILHDPPSGQGASLRIRYVLPRPLGHF